MPQMAAAVVNCEIFLQSEHRLCSLPIECQSRQIAFSSGIWSLFSVKIIGACQLYFSAVLTSFQCSKGAEGVHGAADEPEGEDD